MLNSSAVQATRGYAHTLTGWDRLGDDLALEVLSQSADDLAEILLQVRLTFYSNRLVWSAFGSTSGWPQWLISDPARTGFWCLEDDEREALFLTLGTGLSRLGLSRVCCCEPGVTEARARLAWARLFAMLDEPGSSAHAMSGITVSMMIDAPWTSLLTAP